jgi:DNA-binding MarR family transcriptional regulator
METLTFDQIAVSHALERLISWLRDAREPADISASSISALSRLESGGPLRVTDLAYREGLTQPGMTTLIHRLESAGLAFRESDPTDGRAVRVTITDAGIERVTAFRAARAALIGARLEQLTPEDQHALTAAVPALDHFIAESTPSTHRNRGSKE